MPERLVRVWYSPKRALIKGTVVYRLVDGTEVLATEVTDGDKPFYEDDDVRLRGMATAYSIVRRNGWGNNTPFELGKQAFDKNQSDKNPYMPNTLAFEQFINGVREAHDDWDMMHEWYNQHD